MPLPTFYATGTVSVDNGATTVTGSGTGWGDDSFGLAVIQSGDLFFDPAQPEIPGQRIASVTDASHLVLWAPWPGADMSADAYEIRFLGDTMRSTAQTRRYLEMLGQLAALGIQPNAFGEYADRDAYDEEAKGFIFLSLNGDDGATTTAWTLFTKLTDTDADWSAGQTMEGAPGPQGDNVVWLAAAGAPGGGTGADGDMYLNTTNGDVYGPKAAGAWGGSVGNIKGVQGNTGPANSLAIGTVTGGPSAEATIEGDAPEQILNLVLPKGDTGDAATIAVGTVTTVDPTDPATVTNVGTSGAAVFDFEIPKGPPGAGSVDSVNGDPGPNIVLDADDIDDSTTDHKFATATQLAAVDGLGTAASEDSTAFATAAQGALADTAVQPGDIGNAASRNVGTTAGTVAAGDDSRITGAAQKSANLSDLASAATAFGNIKQAASTSASGVVEIATAAEYATGTDTARALGVAETWDSADLSALTDGATISVNFASGFNFGGASNAALALGGDRTLAAPTNVSKNQAGVLWFSASGATRTLTLNAAWNLATGVEAGPYSITTSQELGIAYVVRGSTVVVTAIIRRG